MVIDNINMQACVSFMKPAKNMMGESRLAAINSAGDGRWTDDDKTFTNVLVALGSI